MHWFAISTVVLVVLAGVVGALLAILLVRERKARERFRVLGEVAAVSDAGGSLEQTIDAICGILVPDVCDFCTIDLIVDGRIRRAAVRVGPDGPPEVERGLAERPPAVPEWMLKGEGRGSLAPRFYERMSDEDLQRLANDAEDLEFLRSIGVRSAITVALNARGKLTGTLTLGTAWSGRHFRREDARYAWILSGRVALALDNCGLFADLEAAERARAEIAETLQRGLLPPPLPSIPGWSIAAMYRPAGVENEVGGDFYDVFRIAGGWMLVIGDVTGRGARAASITAVARYTLRTAAALTADPLRALSTLNRALLARGDSALCSVVALAISENPAQPVRMAVAGHPPPLLVDGETVRETAVAEPILGAFADARWTMVEASIATGQQLVIVTDGIIEADGPASEERFGEARLRAELSGATDPGQVVQRLETALNSFTEGKFDDDIAILAVARARSGPAPETPMASRRLASAASGLERGDG